MAAAISLLIVLFTVAVHRRFGVSATDRVLSAGHQRRSS